MKIPEKAPSIHDASNFKKAFEFANKEEVKQIIDKANYNYLYWDKFKHQPFPLGLSSELAWFILKLSRSTQSKKIPLKNKDQKFFNYWIPDNLLKFLHQIDQNAGGQILVDHFNVDAIENEKEKYMISNIMEEAIASSQLEGAATTRRKAKQMLREGAKPKNEAEKMILNNYRTIKDIKDLVDEDLTGGLIKKIQALITKGTLKDPSAAGRYKVAGEENQVIDQSDGTVLFDPPPISEIENRINELCDFINNYEAPFMHPAIKAIILHFMIAYIHPFVDGNGRTARALFYWYMLKKGYWLFEYLSISRIILKAPRQYYRAFLYSEIDQNDLTYFIYFNLKSIDLAIKELHIYLRYRLQKYQESQKLVRKYPGLNHRQYELVNHAISNPTATYTIKYHKNLHNVSYQTARNDLLELEETSLLEKQKKGHKFVFIPSKNISKKLKENI